MEMTTLHSAEIKFWCNELDDTVSLVGELRATFVVLNFLGEEQGLFLEEKHEITPRRFPFKMHGFRFLLVEV